MLNLLKMASYVLILLSDKMNNWKFIKNSKKLLKSKSLVAGTSLLISSAAVSTSSYAQCTSPTASAGTWQYFTTENAFLYCDGSNWVLEATELSASTSATLDHSMTIVKGSSCPSGTTKVVEDTDGSSSASLCYNAIEIATLT